MRLEGFPDLSPLISSHAATVATAGSAQERRRPPRRRILRAAAALAVVPAGLLAAGSSVAWAHAIILESEPAEGATLPAGAPVAVTLRFNSRIDRERSRLLAVGPDGKETPLALMPGDGDAVVLAARTPPLAVPGAWRLRWQVLARDGHITRGDIRFTVRAAPAAPATAPR